MTWASYVSILRPATKHDYIMNEINKSYDEIVSLFRSDICYNFPDLYNEACRKKKRVSKKKRSCGRYYYPAIRMHSINDFNYVINFFTRGHSEPEKDDFSDLVYAWFLKNGKKYAIVFQHMSDSYIDFHFSIFIPHFFQRYRERYLKTDSMSDRDIMNHYFLHHWRQGMISVPSKKYPDGVYNVTPE